jgi:AmmeMemoRadiSam system protein B
MQPIRAPAVSGTWYPGSAAPLAAAVDDYLAQAADAPRLSTVTALIAPHAGLRYSGPVAAYAYRQIEGRRIDTVVLVGPSHFVGFDGVALCRDGGFDTPLGAAPLDGECAARIMAASPIVIEHPAAQAREHSIEMQLPFVRRLLPHAAIVPMLIGWQTAATAYELGRVLAEVLHDRNAVLIASSDLSHYKDAGTAHALDGLVLNAIERFEPAALQALLDRRADHACGGGPMVAVMDAARALGARDSVVLHYADSGDVSGDKSAVVGYAAAAFGSCA